MNLKAIARNNDNYCNRNSSKSDNFRESNNEKKQRADTKNETKKIKSDNFIRSNIEKVKNLIVHQTIFRLWGAPISFRTLHIHAYLYSIDKLDLVQLKILCCLNHTLYFTNIVILIKKNILNLSSKIFFLNRQETRCRRSLI